MLTTTDFKTAHSLTNSSFLRLSRKVAESLGKVGEPMTKQVTPTEYEILYPEDFLKAVGERKVQKVKEVITEPEVITVELVEETAISIANPLDSYSPLTAYQSQTWSHTDTSEIVEAGKNALANLTFNSLNNQNIGIAALLEHERNEGAKLGVALAQVKLGTANQVKDEVISEYLKKHGLSIA